MKTPFYGQTYLEFVDWAKSIGQGEKPLKKLVTRFHRNPCFPESQADLAPGFLASLEDQFYLSLLSCMKKAVSNDGTIKFLFETHDKQVIESVALRFNKRFTLCLSSQVGCGMNCQFCFTGSMGLRRNLRAYEIVEQYLNVWRELNLNAEHPQTPNIVFMGQGEPFHNFDELKVAIEILMTMPGISLGPKQITVSTVGYLPGLDRLNELPPINLAISLHSPFDHERSQLIPMNKAYSISALFTSLSKFHWHSRKRINFEYLLLSGVNDSDNHAHELASLIEVFPCLVNLIPFNPYPGSQFQRPPKERVESFKRILVQHKVKTMVRQTKGDDVLAACGQLANTV